MIAPVSPSAQPSVNPVELESGGKPPPALRIGMVTHYMPPHMGGIEMVAEALFDSYGAAGCEIRWVASRAPRRSAPREGGRIRVGCWNRFEQWLRVPWPVWGREGMRELRRLVHWADVLHVHDCLYMGSALALLFASRARKPVLLTQHVGFVKYSSAILNGIERLAYSTLGRAVLGGASHLVFPSPTAEEFVTALLRDRPQASTTIPNGIDAKRFHPPTPAARAEARRHLGLPESGHVVLFVGRLVESKGLDLLMEVSRRLPDCHFLVVGEGPLRPARLRNLTWIPFVPPARMDLVYRAANTFMLPAHSEGFPLSVLEAMATGVPVIVSQGEAFVTVLERERACLSSERTPEALCDALTRLLEMPEVAAARAAQARELIVRELSLEVMGERYLNLIRQLSMNNARIKT